MTAHSFLLTTITIGAVSRCQPAIEITERIPFTQIQLFSEVQLLHFIILNCIKMEFYTEMAYIQL